MLTDAERLLHVALDQERARSERAHSFICSAETAAAYCANSVTGTNQLLLGRFLVRAGLATWAYPDLPH